MYVNTLCSKYFVSLNVYEVLVFLSYLENFFPLTYFFPTTCRKYYSQSIVLRIWLVYRLGHSIYGKLNNLMKSIHNKVLLFCHCSETESLVNTVNHDFGRATLHRILIMQQETVIGYIILIIETYLSPFSNSPLYQNLSSYLWPLSPCVIWSLLDSPKSILCLLFPMPLASDG